MSSNHAKLRLDRFPRIESQVFSIAPADELHTGRWAAQMRELGRKTKAFRELSGRAAEAGADWVATLA